MVKGKLVVFLVSQEWQVKKYLTFVSKFDESNEFLFLCSDLLTRGNSFVYLKELNKFNYKLIPKLEVNYLFYSIFSTKYIMNIFRSSYHYDFGDIILISDNFSNIIASAFRNLRFLFGVKLVFIQHGENYFYNQSFNYIAGWNSSNDVVNDDKKKYFKDYVLLVALCIYFRKFSFLLKIFENRLSSRYDFLSFGDKILVSNYLNKDNLIANGIDKDLVNVIGSDLVERKDSFIYSQNIADSSSIFNSAVIYTVGTYRKSLSHEVRIRDKVFYTSLKFVFDSLKIPYFFKLKTDEEFNFKVDFPDCAYFKNSNEYASYCKNASNVLYIVPVDSTLSLELSLLGIPYIAYSTWDSLSAIGRLNQISNVLILHSDISQVDLLSKLEKIIKGQFQIQSIPRSRLELMLGSENESYYQKFYNALL